jgi:hypothetical protein
VSDFLNRAGSAITTHSAKAGSVPARQESRQAPTKEEEKQTKLRYLPGHAIKHAIKMAEGFPAARNDSCRGVLRKLEGLHGIPETGRPGDAR